jgi:8-oxo-dGTP pyrophosphatase MutT (NUDIX family)
MAHIHTKPGQVDHTVEVFVVSGGKVLLRKHDKYGIWLSVGGHIELDEDPNQAALREVKEEVGLDTELLQPENFKKSTQADIKELIAPLFSYRHQVNDEHVHSVHVFFATSQSQKVKPESPSDKWHWFSEEELKKNKYDLREQIQRYALEALKTLS